MLGKSAMNTCDIQSALGRLNYFQGDTIGDSGRLHGRFTHTAGRGILAFDKARGVAAGVGEGGGDQARANRRAGHRVDDPPHCCPQDVGSHRKEANKPGNWPTRARLPCA